MGKFQKGILGGFSGKVGTVVGSTWRGLDIMRSVPKRTHRTPTEAQAEQRERFAVIAHFLRPVNPILRSYFGQQAAEKSRSNLATSYHMTDAMLGVYPNFTVDFQKVILSKGELLGLQDMAANPVAGARLDLTWTDNSGQGQAKSDDAVVVAVFNEQKGLWDYLLVAGVRTASNITYQMPANWAGDTVHCYSTVASADGKLYGNSVWFGPLVAL